MRCANRTGGQPIKNGRTWTPSSLGPRPKSGLRITQSLDRNQEKIKQLMDRFNSLMSEGRYLLAEEAAATEVAETAPE